MSSNTQTQNDFPTGKEAGLIKHLSRRNRQLEFSQNETKRTARAALEAMVSHSIAHEVIAKFIVSSEIFWAEKQKAMTTIRDYTNKKGVTSRVHYTPNGRWYGTTKKYGEEPVECEYNRLITSEWATGNWYWDYDITNITGTRIQKKEVINIKPKPKKKHKKKPPLSQAVIDAVMARESN